MLTILMILGVTSAAQWPKHLERCLKSDLKMEQYLLSAAKEALPYVAKGIPEIGLEPLDPLTEANFSLGNDVGPVILKVKMEHAIISGPSKMQLQKIIYNEKQSRLEITALHKVLKMTGNFNAKGHILLIPVNSKGFFTFDFREVQALHTFKIKKNAQERFKDNDLSFKVNNLVRVSVNLKDHNHVNYHSLNRLVNDNWKLVSRAMIPSMEKSIQKVYTKALSPIFNTFTLEDIFPNEISISAVK